jgi:AcrR family transcriptional regulator
LFPARGINATGIDSVLARAGVAKQSLYDHFGGKDALIEAYVREQDAAFSAWFTGQMADAPPDPRGRLLHTLDVLGRFIAGEAFCGCVFLGAIEELADAAHPARRAAWGHKRAFRDALAALARDAGAAEPALLAEQLSLLVDGVLIAARADEHDGQRALAAAKAAAGALLAVAAGPAPTNR